jgi:hypothetical protein
VQAKRGALRSARPSAVTNRAGVVACGTLRELAAIAHDKRK